MFECNSIESTFGQAAILIGSQRDSFAAVAHCLSEPFFRGATVKEIPLTQGKVALVDDEDYERVRQVRWYASQCGQTWYARHTGNDPRDRLRMHRFILDLKAGDPRVDHRDGNGLNNTRANIRLASSLQNNRNCRRRKNNKSGFKGVWPGEKGWRIGIRVSGRYISSSGYPTPESAAVAYDELAKRHFGEFAKLNFPAEPQGGGECS